MADLAFAAGVLRNLVKSRRFDELYGCICKRQTVGYDPPGHRRGSWWELLR